MTKQNRVSIEWLDLTHEITETIPTWDGSWGFHHEPIVRYDDGKEGCKFLIHQIKMQAGIGTHMDAPAHCFPGAQTIGQLPLEALITPCAVINVADKADEDYEVSQLDIENFEEEYGPIQEGSLVIVYTGWDRFWDQPEKYRNDYRFPTISSHAAQYLISQDVAGIGIDTLSPDKATDDFPVHQIVLGAGKYIIENVANASQMPPLGGYTLAVPMRIKEGTEAPIRLLGMFPVA